jgi:hypothetical protein
MHLRSILSLAMLVSATWAASFLFAMGCAGFAIVAFYTEDIPSPNDVALYSLVGIAAFSFPLSLVMTLPVSTCGTTREDVVFFWVASMFLTASMAPAVGGAIFNAPNTVALLNGCILGLVVMAVLVPLVYGMCLVYCSDGCCRGRGRRERFDPMPDAIIPSGIEPPTEPPRVPYIVIDHPGGELHVGRPVAYEASILKQ